MVRSFLPNWYASELTVFAFFSKTIVRISANYSELAENIILFQPAARNAETGSKDLSRYLTRSRSFKQFKATKTVYSISELTVMSN